MGVDLLVFSDHGDLSAEDDGREYFTRNIFMILAP